MNAPESAPLLEQFLRELPRRYRLPSAVAPLPSPDTLLPPISQQAHLAAGDLAAVIEAARQAGAAGIPTPPELEPVFVKALHALIEDALQENGDPVFQASVLRHQHAPLQEYASLENGADHDRRRILGAVNALAHPEKLARTPEGPQRLALQHLHEVATKEDWKAVAKAAAALVSEGVESAATILADPALARLQRMTALMNEPMVVRYRELWEKSGPRAGSNDALENGSVSRKRGDAVEAMALNALRRLAEALNLTEADQYEYQVVGSLRVPASIPASPDRAKSEWDVVLLQRRVDTATQAWDICLLVEAKASADAAPGDFARLLRGLQLLAHADPAETYAFPTRHGLVQLNGASLSRLSTDEESVQQTVLYCCDSPADAAPRLLSAGSRMQLLSAPATLAYAAALWSGQPADPAQLATVWHEIQHATHWRGVFQQYATLRRVRELMVHPDDMLATAERILAGVQAGAEAGKA